MNKNSLSDLSVFQISDIIDELHENKSDLENFVKFKHQNPKYLNLKKPTKNSFNALSSFPMRISHFILQTLLKSQTFFLSTLSINDDFKVNYF